MCVERTIGIMFTHVQFLKLAISHNTTSAQYPNTHQPLSPNTFHTTYPQPLEFTHLSSGSFLHATGSVNLLLLMIHLNFALLPKLPTQTKWWLGDCAQPIHMMTCFNLTLQNICSLSHIIKHWAHTASFCNLDALVHAAANVRAEE